MHIIKDCDSQLLAIDRILPILAGCLKDGFKPFLPQLMEAIFRDITRSLDFKVVEAVEEELEEKEEDDGGFCYVKKIHVKVKDKDGGTTTKVIHMNTVALENKTNALRTVCGIA